MQRFYKDVTVGPAVGGGYVVMLDGRPVRTPAKSLMAASTRTLADAVAAEWAAQDAAIVPETMPLTQLLTTEIDRAIPERAAITQTALTYIDSDLLCYLADEPQSLAEEQARVWSPWLTWFANRYGAALATTSALIRLDQPQAAHTAARTGIDLMDAGQFTVFQAITALCGSAVLGLAAAAAAIDSETLWRAALCEELFYEKSHDLERHGLDPAEQKRRDGLRRDLDAAIRYLALTRTATT